jgi:hypothetical protein
MLSGSPDGENGVSCHFPTFLLLQYDSLLNLEEHDCLSPCDTTLLIQNFDWVLGVGQVHIEWCHFRQHNIHGAVKHFSCDTWKML